jgi:ureidoglycolate lyase
MDRLRASAAGRRILRPMPLGTTSFAPYGQVIDRRGGRPPQSINDGSAVRLDDLGRVDAELRDAHVGISLVRATPRALPFRLECVERHRRSTQAFVPLSGLRWLVVVAPAGRAPATGDLHAFWASGEQGVNYARGTWHHPLLVIDEVAEFVVIDRIANDGRDDNCDVLDLSDEAIWIDAPESVGRRDRSR